MIILTDCFNVLDQTGASLYIGKGSANVASGSAEVGIAWTQEALNSIFLEILEVSY